MEVIKWEVDGPALTFTPKGKTSAVFQKCTSKGEEGIEEGRVSGAPPTARETLHPDAPPSEEKSVNEAPKSTTHSKAMEETSSKSCVWFKIKFEIKKVLCTMHLIVSALFVDIGLIWCHLSIVDLKDIVCVFIRFMNFFLRLKIKRL